MLKAFGLWGTIDAQSLWALRYHRCSKPSGFVFAPPRAWPVACLHVLIVWVHLANSTSLTLLPMCHPSLQTLIPMLNSVFQFIEWKVESISNENSSTTNRLESLCPTQYASDSRCFGLLDKHQEIYQHWTDSQFGVRIKTASTRKPKTLVHCLSSIHTLLPW